LSLFCLLGALSIYFLILSTDGSLLAHGRLLIAHFPSSQLGFSFRLSSRLFLDLGFRFAEFDVGRRKYPLLPCHCRNKDVVLLSTHVTTSFVRRSGARIISVSWRGVRSLIRSCDALKAGDIQIWVLDSVLLIFELRVVVDIAYDLHKQATCALPNRLLFTISNNHHELSRTYLYPTSDQRSHSTAVSHHFTFPSPRAPNSTFTIPTVDYRHRVARRPRSSLRVQGQQTRLAGSACRHNGSPWLRLQLK
jgi:hypothetical protein